MRGRFWLAALGLAALVMAQLPDAKVKRDPPFQPIPFNHKLHVAQGLKCAECHAMPEPGDFATYPKTATCMACHVAIKTDSVHIKKLAGITKEGKKVQWTPVYRIPEWVSFNHKKHMGVTGVTCESCHGPVATRVELFRGKDLSMDACMQCHRQNNGPNGCLVCHDQR